MNKRRRGRWRWIYSGMHVAGVIERDETGRWMVFVGKQLVGVVASEELAERLCRACASRGDRERSG